MFKKLKAPYRHAPAIISTHRIDDLLARRATAGVQGAGRRSRKAVDLVTFTVNGRVIDQFTVHGRVSGTAEFVASFNRKVAEQR